MEYKTGLQEVGLSTIVRIKGHLILSDCQNEGYPCTIIYVIEGSQGTLKGVGGGSSSSGLSGETTAICCIG